PVHPGRPPGEDRGEPDALLPPAAAARGVAIRSHALERLDAEQREAVAEHLERRADEAGAGDAQRVRLGVLDAVLVVEGVERAGELEQVLADDRRLELLGGAPQR